MGGGGGGGEQEKTRENVTKRTIEIALPVVCMQTIGLRRNWASHSQRMGGAVRGGREGREGLVRRSFYFSMDTRKGRGGIPAGRRGGRRGCGTVRLIRTSEEPWPAQPGGPFRRQDES